jgi:hypothetical protein
MAGCVGACAVSVQVIATMIVEKGSNRMGPS